MTERLKKVCKATLRVTAIVVLTLVLLAVSSCVFMPKNNQEEFGMGGASANGIMGEPSNTIDVVFIGDSETYHSFSPLQLFEENGFTSYVCGTAAQTLPFSNTMLHRALRSQSPTIVVFETNSFFREFEADEIIARAIMDTFPVFEYHNRWKDLTLSDMTSLPTATWTDPFKNYYLVTSVEPADAEGYMSPSDEIEEIPRLNREVIIMMVEYCRENGVTPVFMSVPSTRNWNYARHNAMVELSQELGVDYYDLNVGEHQVVVDWGTDTYDAGDHLNHSGATKVGRSIAPLLAQTYALADHREDGDYATWLEALERYHQKIDAA